MLKVGSYFVQRRYFRSAEVILKVVIRPMSGDCLGVQSSRKNL